MTVPSVPNKYRTGSSIALALALHGIALAIVAPELTVVSTPETTTACWLWCEDSTDDSKHAIELLLEVDTSQLPGAEVAGIEEQPQQQPTRRFERKVVAVPLPQVVHVVELPTQAPNAEVVEQSSDAVVEARPARSLDLYTEESRYLAIAPELKREAAADRYRVAEAALNDKMAKEWAEGDRLTLHSLDSLTKTHVLNAFRASSIQTATPLVVQFLVTPDGTISDLQLSIAGTSPAPRRMFARLLMNGTLHNRTKRHVKYTYELSQATQLASGRTAGTGLSLGPFDVLAPKAPDSPQVKVVPPKLTWSRPLKLSRDRTTMQQDQGTEDYYVEQWVFETNVDPADLAASEMRTTRARLLRRQVQ